MNVEDPLATLRAEMRPHGYYVFLQPDRPSGWLAILRSNDPELVDPVEVRTPTREEAVEAAREWFIMQRCDELHAKIRAAGFEPPPWTTEQRGSKRIDVLTACAVEHGVVV